MTIETFEHIARKLRPLLQSIGHRFFADPSRADDVAQEVLMRLWLMRERVNVEQGVEPLAVRMAKNYCVNEKKKAQRTQPLTLSEAATALPPSEGQTIPLSHEVGQLFQSLAPYEQRLLRLRYEWDMPVGEIATIMGISPRSVSSIISTAKRKLQEQLEKGGQL